MAGNTLDYTAAEQYSKSFTSKILEESFPANNLISGQQILEVTPIKQVNFFVLKVLFLQWQEETKKFQSPFFDYSKPEVKDALKGLVNTLSKNILIKKEAFRPLLEKAVLETLTLMFDHNNYFINEFTNLPNVTRIQGFKGLTKYVKIRKNIFNSVVQKLDADGSQVITDDEIKTLVQFVSGQNPAEDDEIQEDTSRFDAILSLDIFESEPEPEAVEEDDETEVENEIEIEAEETSEVDESPEEDEILIEIDNEEEEVETGSIIIEEEQLEEIDQDTAEEDGGIIIDRGDEEEQIVTENMDAEFSPVVETETEILDVPNSVNEKFSEEKTTLNETFEKETQTVSTIAEVHETEKVSEIQKSISVNQRYMFLSDLFNGDESAYNTALQKVEESNSFDDSVELLVQNYSKQYEWDMNSDEVKELLKVIFKRFR
ncbi:MAG: hypothetical protein JXQ96_01225 [Cyclobacteriaceae bacterium]